MADYHNNRETIELSYPVELRDPQANFPHMIFEIQKYPAIASFKVKDNEKSTSKGELGALGYLGQFVSGSAINEGFSRDGFNPPTSRNGQAKPKIVSTIQLPITNNVSNAIGIDWQMTETIYTQAFLDKIGQMRDAMDVALTDENFGYAGAFIAGQWETGQFAKETMARAVASDLIKKWSNQMVNPKMQALFGGVGARTFNFEYIFTPTSLEEAETVEKIIKTFTMFSLPNIEKDAIIMDFPHEFKISFKGVKGFPILDNCVCTGIATNYTPNTLQLFEDGHSIQIVMSLSFLETTLRSQNRAGI